MLNVYDLSAFCLAVGLAFSLSFLLLKTKRHKDGAIDESKGVWKKIFSAGEFNRIFYGYNFHEDDEEDNFIRGHDRRK